MRDEEARTSIETAKEFLSPRQPYSRTKKQKLSDLITAAMHVGLAVRFSVRDLKMHAEARGLETKIRREAEQLLD